jgi:hypothetical protein
MAQAQNIPTTNHIELTVAAKNESTDHTERNAAKRQSQLTAKMTSRIEEVKKSVLKGELINEDAHKEFKKLMSVPRDPFSDAFLTEAKVDKHFCDCCRSLRTIDDKTHKKEEQVLVLLELELNTRVWWTGDKVKDYIIFTKLRHPAIALFCYHRQHSIHPFERFLILLASGFMAYVGAFIKPEVCDDSLGVLCNNSCMYMDFGLLENYTNDGECDDKLWCQWGMDCHDCGPRNLPEFCQQSFYPYIHPIVWGLSMAVFMIFMKQFAVCPCTAKRKPGKCKGTCETIGNCLMIFVLGLSIAAAFWVRRYHFDSMDPLQVLINILIGWGITLFVNFIPFLGLWKKGNPFSAEFSKLIITAIRNYLVDVAGTQTELNKRVADEIELREACTSNSDDWTNFVLEYLKIRLSGGVDDQEKVGNIRTDLKNIINVSINNAAARFNSDNSFLPIFSDEMDVEQKSSSDRNGWWCKECAKVCTVGESLGVKCCVACSCGHLRVAHSPATKAQLDSIDEKATHLIATVRAFLKGLAENKYDGKYIDKSKTIGTTDESKNNYSWRSVTQREVSVNCEVDKNGARHLTTQVELGKRLHMYLKIARDSQVMGYASQLDYIELLELKKGLSPVELSINDLKTLATIKSAGTVFSKFPLENVYLELEELFRDMDSDKSGKLSRVSTSYYLVFDCLLLLLFSQ